MRRIAGIHIRHRVDVAVQDGRYEGTIFEEEFPLKEMPKLSEVDLSVSIPDDEYKKELDDLGVEKKTLYTKFFDGSITEKEADRLRAIEAAEKKIKISNYSLENVDEFWGEAFADAKLGENPGKYSKKAEEIANRYFKRSLF